LKKEKWSEWNISGGTGFYGDNGEFPTYERALKFGLQKALEQIK
jgi:hypothetical protein